MKTQINIAELLEDCPKGMELYSPLCGKCVFDRLNFGTIICKKQNTQEITFTSKGYYMLPVFDDCECMIFPSKDQRDWSKFVPPYKFKDGDIYYIKDVFGLEFVSIIKKCENNKLYTYVDIGISTKSFYCDESEGLCYCKDIIERRLATEDEKAKLFQAIKDNGYHWNPESKTLEKLMESKEETNEDVVMSGIYFDRENYADEVELHLGNYEIEVRDGKTYAVYKNQETKISKPIFKIGDKIKHKDTVLTIINVQTNSYIVEDEPDNFGLLMFSQQDKWELINEPKFKVGDKIRHKINNDIYEISAVYDGFYGLVDYAFMLDMKYQDLYELAPTKFDINTLVPFESRILVRHNNDNKWCGSFFSHIDGNFHSHCYKYVTIAGKSYPMCIPYEGNEHLLGTTNDCIEYYKTW